MRLWGGSLQKVESVLSLNLKQPFLVLQLNRDASRFTRPDLDTSKIETCQGWQPAV